MSKFIVVVEEGEVDLGRMGQISHHNDFIKLRLIIFEDVDIFSHFLVSIVLILHLQIYVSISVDVI